MIINLAPTGIVPIKEINKYTPITTNEIIADVNYCAAAGANIVHIHARDEDGLPTYKKEVYAKIIAGIRERHPKLVICVSLSGRIFTEYEQRADPLNLTGDLRPDMASLTLGSMNFMQDVSINDPRVIKRLVMRMSEVGIKPELEIFDLGMVNYAKYLMQQFLITPPYYINVILNNIASAQVDMLHLGTIINSFPEQGWLGRLYWCVGGVGHKQLESNVLGIMFGDGVRVGIEDNPGAGLSNSQLLCRIVSLSRELGKKIYSHEEVRNLLRL